VNALGLDLSLAATGWAAVDTDTGRIHAETIATKPGDALPRMRYVLSQIPHLQYPTEAPALVCMEAPSYGSGGGQAHERAGLWWMVRDQIDRIGAPFALVPPKSLKLYATGAGTASKTQMTMALSKRLGERCPDVEDDNCVDAAWLALAAAHRLGSPVVTLPAAQVAALDRVKWPELLSDDGGDDVQEGAA
jgi:crossover junction endodeoxyribonuclease RuvC